MATAGFEELADQYERWIHGEFAPDQILADFGSWDERNRRSAGSSEEWEESRRATGHGEKIEDLLSHAAESSAATEGTLTNDELPAKGRVGTRLGSDRAAVVDQLGRARLANVLAQFLRDPNTETPTTLSIEGPWGSGKSSLMGMIRRALDPTPDERKATGNNAPAVPTVAFNPWRLATHEELWATFALTVLSAARDRLPGRARLWARWRLEKECMDWQRFWTSVLHTGAKLALLTVGTAIVVGVATITLPLGRGVQLNEFGEWLRWLGLPSGAVAALFGVHAVWQWCRENAGGLLEGRIEAQMKRPDYQARVSFLSEFHDDFERALRCYLGEGQRMVVLIDDLDRCDVPRAAELMQGINLMLGDRLPLIYVLGLDRAKVAAGIAVKHKELLPYLYADELAKLPAEHREAALKEHGIRYGYEFIEKFIQVPLSLPAVEPAEIDQFVRSRLEMRPAPDAGGMDLGKALSIVDPEASGARPNQVDSTAGQSTPANVAGPRQTVSESVESRALPEASAAPPAAARTDESHLVEPILDAATVLDGNPRRVAQLINLVRLQRLLLEAYGLEEVSDELLAKWTAVALRWPGLIVQLQRDALLRGNLDSPFTFENLDSTYTKWSDPLRFLRKKTSDGSDIEWPGAFETLLKLSGTVPVAIAGKKAGVEERTAEAAEA